MKLRIVFLALLFLVACSSSEDNYSALCPDCNVIMVSIDTLRQDHVGVYGYEKNTTPNIDRIAEEGFVFKNARSESSWTAPAHASLLFSKFPHELNFYKYTQIEDIGKIQDTEVGLAEVFQQNGYVTQAFTGDAYVSRDYNFNQGFDNFHEIVTMGKFDPYLSKVTDWISRNQNKQFFLFLHGYNTHQPYKPKPEYFKLFYPGNEPVNLTDFCSDYTKKDSLLIPDSDLEVHKAKYDGEIREVDDLLQQVWDQVEAVGIDKKTILVILSDHGDEFFEHGSCDHVKTLYDELIKVPLIFKVPGIKGKPIFSSAQLSDVYPTLLDIVGIPLESNVSGRSLVPAMTGSQESRPQLAMTGVFDIKIRSLTFEDWKLIETMPVWKLLPYKKATHDIIEEGSLNFIKLDPNDVRLLIDFDPFRALKDPVLRFSMRVKAETSTILRFGFEGQDLMEVNVSDEWIVVNSSNYVVDDRYRVRLIVELSNEQESVLIDELSLFEANAGSLLRHFNFDGNDRTYELYNLEDDPGEQEKLVELKQLLDENFANAVEGEVEGVELREEVKDMLKSLGYVG